MKNEAGKGDSYRKVDLKKWSENYNRIFGKKKDKTLNGNSKKNRSLQRS
jgi:hypothetical protein